MLTVIILLILFILVGYDLATVKRSRISHMIESWAQPILAGLIFTTLLGNHLILVYNSVYQQIDKLTGIESSPLTMTRLPQRYYIGMYVFITVYVSGIVYLKIREYRQQQHVIDIRTGYWALLAYMAIRNKPLSLPEPKTGNGDDGELQNEIEGSIGEGGTDGASVEEDDISADKGIEECDDQ